jgi:aspartate/methionine/tyrosine aminotransferase
MNAFSSRIPGSASPNALALALAKRRALGLPILNMVESNPTRVGFERPASAFLEPLARAEDLDYAPEPRGLKRPREALAAYLSARGAAIRPGELFLCASTSEAYGWLFKLLCEPGDAVLVPKPGYPLFDYLAGLECVEARPYPLDYAHPRGWLIDLDAMEAALRRGRVKAIVLINPNNPTGSYVGEAERRAVLDLAGRYGAALIVDEVFLGFPVESGGGFSFRGENSVLCFVLDGLSKLLGLPQMKLGWISVSGPQGPVAEAEGRLEIIADTYLSAGTPVMNALPSYLAEAPAFAMTAGERIRANLASLRSILEDRESPHRVLRCDGGWTALVEAPRIDSEEELALALLAEEGLALHPGYYFDMASEAYFAVSLILRPAELEEGARRYRSFFDRRLA